jgi:hypothetical protein
LGSSCHILRANRQNNSSVGASQLSGGFPLLFPIAAAALFAAINLAITRLHPKRYFWFGLSVFSPVVLLGAAPTYCRTERNPQIAPAAVVLPRGHGLPGLFVSVASDRIYLANVDTDGSSIVSHSGRVFWVKRSSVCGMSIGELRAERRAACGSGPR